jgi:hypothetical protein
VPEKASGNELQLGRRGRRCGKDDELPVLEVRGPDLATQLGFQVVDTKL